MEYGCLSGLWDWPQCSNDVVRPAGYKGQAETARARQRVREGRPISWEEYWSDHLFHPSSSSSAFFSEGEVEWHRQGRGHRLKESEWDGEKDTDKGMMAPQQHSLCQAYSSVLCSSGAGNRLIIYSHNLSSGVAPKHSIITTNAQAAVKHFSQQALKMLCLSIWNAHPSRWSSSLSITS